MLVRDNTDRSRFELLDGDEVLGFIDYLVRDGVYWLIHTETEVEGRGVGTALVEGALDDLRARNIPLVPICPFVVSWLQAHRDRMDQVDRKAWRAHKQQTADRAD